MDEWDQFQRIEEPDTPAGQGQQEASPWDQFALADAPVETPEETEEPKSYDHQVGFDRWAKPSGATAADYGSTIMEGFAGLGSGIGWLVDKVGFEDVGGFIQEQGDSAANYWASQLSPAAKAAREKEYFSSDPNDGEFFGEAWKDLDTLGLSMAGSIPGTMAGMGVGGFLAKGLQLVPGISAGVAGMLGFSAGEAMVAAPMTGADTEKRIREMSFDELSGHVEWEALMLTEVDPETAREMLADAAGGDAAMRTAIATAVLSGPFGKVLGEIGQEAVTRTGAMTRGGLTEFGQEFLQSGGEQVAQNFALLSQGKADQVLSEGVLESSFGGAAAGLGMGVAFGASEDLNSNLATNARRANARAYRRSQKAWQQRRDQAADEAGTAAEAAGADDLEQELARAEAYVEYDDREEFPYDPDLEQVDTDPPDDEPPGGGAPEEQAAFDIDEWVRRSQELIDQAEEPDGTTTETTIELGSGIITDATEEGMISLSSIPDLPVEDPPEPQDDAKEAKPYLPDGSQYEGEYSEEINGSVTSTTGSLSSTDTHDLVEITTSMSGAAYVVRNKETGLETIIQVNSSDGSLSGQHVTPDDQAAAPISDLSIEQLQGIVAPGAISAIENVQAYITDADYDLTDLERDARRLDTDVKNLPDAAPYMPGSKPEWKPGTASAKDNFGKGDIELSFDAYVAQLGGVQPEGSEQADAANVTSGILRMFTKGGMSTDDLLEQAKEDGWLSADADKQDLESLISDARMGKNVWHPANSKAAEWELQQQEQSAKEQAEAKEQYDQDMQEFDEFLRDDDDIPFFDDPDSDIATLMMEASLLGLSDQEIEDLLDNEEEDRARELRNEINERKLFGRDKGADEEVPGAEVQVPTVETRQEGGGPSDLFGAVPVKEQELADLQRERDEKRDGRGADVPADIDGGLFSNQQDQIDIGDDNVLSDPDMARVAQKYKEKIDGILANPDLQNKARQAVSADEKQRLKDENRMYEFGSGELSDIKNADYYDMAVDGAPLPDGATKEQRDAYEEGLIDLVESFEAPARILNNAEDAATKEQSETEKEARAKLENMPDRQIKSMLDEVGARTKGKSRDELIEMVVTFQEVGRIFATQDFQSLDEAVKYFRGNRKDDQKLVDFQYLYDDKRFKHSAGSMQSQRAQAAAAKLRDAGAIKYPDGRFDVVPDKESGQEVLARQEKAEKERKALVQRTADQMSPETADALVEKFFERVGDKYDDIKDELEENFRIGLSNEPNPFDDGTDRESMTPQEGAWIEGDIALVRESDKQLTREQEGAATEDKYKLGEFRKYDKNSFEHMSPVARISYQRGFKYPGWFASAELDRTWITPSNEEDNKKNREVSARFQINSYPQEYDSQYYSVNKNIDSPDHESAVGAMTYLRDTLRGMRDKNQDGLGDQLDEKHREALDYALSNVEAWLDATNIRTEVENLPDGLYAKERALEKLDVDSEGARVYAEGIIVREKLRDKKGAVIRERKPYNPVDRWTPYDEYDMYQTGEVDAEIRDDDLIEAEPFEQGAAISTVLWRNNQVSINLATKAKSDEVISQEEADARIEEWKEHALAQSERGAKGPDGSPNYSRTVISLFDHTGLWSQPYVDAGYEVVKVDIEDGVDIEDIDFDFLTENLQNIGDVYAILAACPCTVFSQSASRTYPGQEKTAWKLADENGGTEAAKAVVFRTLQLIEFLRPAVWAIENPTNSRMGDTIRGERGIDGFNNATGLPRPTLNFNPHHFGLPYTKPTSLWGNFNPDLPQANVKSEGSWTNKFGGNSKKTSIERAAGATSEGFAYAFFMANNFNDTTDSKYLHGWYNNVIGAMQEAQKYAPAQEVIRVASDNIVGDGIESDEAVTALYELAKDNAGTAAPQPDVELDGDYQAHRDAWGGDLTGVSYMDDNGKVWIGDVLSPGNAENRVSDTDWYGDKAEITISKPADNGARTLRVVLPGKAPSSKEEPFMVPVEGETPETAVNSMIDELQFHETEDPQKERQLQYALDNLTAWLDVSLSTAGREQALMERTEPEDDADQYDDVIAQEQLKAEEEAKRRDEEFERRVESMDWDEFLRDESARTWRQEQDQQIINKQNQAKWESEAEESRAFFEREQREREERLLTSRAERYDGSALGNARRNIDPWVVSVETSASEGFVTHQLPTHSYTLSGKRMRKKPLKYTDQSLRDHWRPKLQKVGIAHTGTGAVVAARAQAVTEIFDHYFAKAYKSNIAPPSQETLDGWAATLKMKSGQPVTLESVTALLSGIASPMEITMYRDALRRPTSSATAPETPLSEIEVTESFELEEGGEVEVTQSAEDARDAINTQLKALDEIMGCSLGDD